MKNIIINADDYGHRSSANKAIVDLFDNGLLSSTTLMANMPGFDEAIELAHAHHITEKIGAHLVLTEGSPLTEEIKLLPYLFKQGKNPGKLLTKKLFFLNKGQQRLIFNEYSRQIEKIRKGGIIITHLDTHQQMHDNWGIIQVMLELLNVYQIPSMRIVNNLGATKFYKKEYRNLVNRYLTFKKVNYSNYFGNQLEYFLALEKKTGLKDKVVEIMVHPDYNEQGKLIDIIKKKEYNFNNLSALQS